MANWSNPLLTSTYTNFLTEVKDRDTDLALQFDGTTSSNIPTGAIRWNSSVNRWQKWNGSSWGELTSTYALTGLSTTGNASIGGTLGSGAFTSSGTVTGTALLPTGSTVPANGIYLPSANTLGLATSTTCRVLVDSNGRVGIGTTSPSTGLHIANAPGSATIGNLYISNSGQARIHLYNSGGTAEWIFGQKTGGDHNFKLSKSVAGSESDYFIIDTSGNVGIGTNPTAVKLYVGGQITGNSSSFALRASNGSGTGQTSTGLTREGATTDQKTWELLQGSDGRFEIRTVNDAYSTGQPGITFDRGAGVNIDSLQLLTMGSPRVHINSSGSVGIGTTSPAYSLDVNGQIRGASSQYALLASNGSGSGQTTIGLRREGGATDQKTWEILTGASGEFSVRTITDGYTAGQDVFIASRGSGFTVDNIRLLTNGSERLRVDSSGKLLVGTSSASQWNHYSSDLPLQVARANSLNTAIQITSFRANDEYGSNVILGKSRSNTLGTNTAISDGDFLGELVFAGANGTSWSQGAGISARADGQTWANGDCPTRLVFSTTADGAASPTERMKITQAGNVGIGASGPGTSLDVQKPAASATIGNVRVSPSSAGQARYHLYNGGATAEWLFGQKTSTDHDFKLSKSVGGSESDYLAITTGGLLKFDSGYGSAATAYGCRAWVNFDGTGANNTNQTIRASGNVTSVYKNDTGDYQVNFATAMPDANYAVTITSNAGSGGIAVKLVNPTTTGFSFQTSGSDGSITSATVIR